MAHNGGRPAPASGAETGQLVRAVARRDGRHAAQPVPQAGHRPLSGRPASVPGPVPRHPRPGLREGHRRGGLHRLPPLRVHLPAAGHQGRDAEEREAELREDLHARAVRVRVLRAVRAGVPDRRDHHDEVVRSGHGRSPRPPARQGPAPRDRPDVRAVLGHRQPVARHAGAAQAGQRRGSRGRQGEAKEPAE